MEKVNARTQALTRPMTWGEMPAFTAQNAQKKGNVIRMMEKMLGAAKRSEILRRSVKKYGIGIAAALLLWSWTAGACAIARNNAIRETEERLAAEYAVQLEQYKAEQARAVQAEHFLSGDASREAFVNQEIDAAARLAAKMSNDTQKGGIIGNALARVRNKAYPGTTREVIAQPDQWMFYDPENKFSTHDREIAEKILRAYYEDGIVPVGLTDEYVYGSWSTADYVLRNTWDFGSATRTWRYQG